MITMYSSLTWGIYEKPPVDVPECGFLGEICLTPVRGKSFCFPCLSIHNNQVFLKNIQALKYILKFY